MKKIRIITGLTIVALVAGVLVFNSCSKQELKEQTAATKQQVKMSDEDIATHKKIMDFKNKIEYIKDHPEYKSGKTMTLEEAQWNLDASFNYTYSFVFESFSGFYTDSVFVEVSFDGGLLSLDDISTAYFEIYEKLHDIYDAAPGNDKDLYISTTEVKDISANTVTFKSTATFGERGVPPTEQPFAEGDNWMWGEGGGLCPGDDPDDDPDAATKIAEATIEYRDLYIQDVGDGWRAYYTNPSHTVTAVADYELWREDNPLDNYRDYLMFYAHRDYCPDGTTIEDFMCIEWEDMNWYYFGMNEIIYSIIPDHPEIWPEVQGKTFTNISIAGEKSTDMNGIIDLYHEADITYRTRWIIADVGYPIKF